MILIMLTISLILFLLFEGNKYNVAGKVLGPYSTLDAARPLARPERL